jgi:hypothetical protein
VNPYFETALLGTPPKRLPSKQADYLQSLGIILPSVLADRIGKPPKRYLNKVAVWSHNGLCNRRGLLSCDSKAFEHFTMECCVEQLFRLPTTRILAWNICWLALLPEPIGITSCKPTPRTYPHDAQLDYFRIADDSG